MVREVMAKLRKSVDTGHPLSCHGPVMGPPWTLWLQLQQRASQATPALPPKPLGAIFRLQYSKQARMTSTTAQNAPRSCSSPILFSPALACSVSFLVACHASMPSMPNHAIATLCRTMRCGNPQREGEGEDEDEGLEGSRCSAWFAC